MILLHEEKYSIRDSNIYAEKKKNKRIWMRKEEK